MGVDAVEGGGGVLEQFDQLAGGGAEVGGGGLHVVFVRGDGIEGLGEEGGEVVVAGIDDDAPAAAAGLPEIAGGCGVRRVRIPTPRGLGVGIGESGGAVLEGEFEAEAEEGGAMVLLLAAPLTGLGGEAGGAVAEDDGCFDLVTVLAAGAAAAGALGIALGEQAVGRVGGGVGWEIFDFRVSTFDCCWSFLTLLQRGV